MKPLASVVALVAGCGSASATSSQASQSSQASRSTPASQSQSPLRQVEVVATFTDTRPGNVAVTPAGRIIMTNQPLDRPALAAVEVLPDGRTVPFPNEEWASAPNGEGVGISGSIGVASDRNGVVWLLDMGSANAPPQLIAWDTEADQLQTRIEIPAEVVTTHSFLQDFALDEQRGLIYIADMTFPPPGVQPQPAFIVVDTSTGQARRVLQGADALMPVERDLVINGSLVAATAEDGTALPLHMSLNPIAIDPSSEWVYFGTVNGPDVFRVPAAALAAPELAEPDLVSQIERYATKPPCDGIAVDAQGRVFVSDIVASGVGIATPSGYELIAQDDELLAWPDGFAFGPGGALYVTQNQLYGNAALNEGVDESTHEYRLVRLSID